MQSRKILYLFSKPVCHLALVGLVPLDLNPLRVTLFRRTPRLQQSERLPSPAALLCVAAPGGHAATSTASTHGGRHRLTQPHLRRGVGDSLTRADRLVHINFCFPILLFLSNLWWKLHFYKFGLEVWIFVDNICIHLSKKNLSLIHFIKRYIAWTCESLDSLLSSSRSTKLTVDMGSSPSLSNGSKERAGSTCHSSRPPAASYYLAADDKHDATLTAEEATQYLELSSKPERCRWVACSRTSFVVCLSQRCWFSPGCSVGFHCWGDYFANVIDYNYVSLLKMQ